ncbi:urease accessory protein UreE [Spiribacter sp. 221]|uniref:urease accessory protein UreE n=1 Tax=Spiribacter onubensis TaxID=3122420 RepID=UPI00349F7D51
MLEFETRIDELAEDTPVEGVLVLTIAQRERTRFRATLTDGREAGVLLPRGGPVLRHGDRLADAEGRVVRVEAAPEPVSTVHDEDPWQLMRAAYHLGNRHMPLEIGRRWLRYRRDHVLDEMVRGLGLSVIHEDRPFQPEAGAYGHGHGHAHHHHE